jgi:hypothetical protein
LSRRRLRLSRSLVCAALISSVMVMRN